MLDNHLVELGTQGRFILFCRLFEEEGRSNPLANSPRVRYKPSSHPCEEKKLATTLCTWSHNVVTELLPSLITYAHVDNGKLEPRAVKCIFLDYGSGFKAYKLWNPETKKVLLSRNVIFNEAVMYYD